MVKQIKCILDNDLVTTDEYHTDQLIIYMALADGVSTIVNDHYSMHTRTMVELLKIFIPKIKIEVNEISNDKDKAYYIEVHGIGYMRE